MERIRTKTLPHATVPLPLPMPYPFGSLVCCLQGAYHACSTPTIYVCNIFQIIQLCLFCCTSRPQTTDQKKRQQQDWGKRSSKEEDELAVWNQPCWENVLVEFRTEELLRLKNNLIKWAIPSRSYRIINLWFSCCFEMPHSTGLVVWQNMFWVISIPIDLSELPNPTQPQLTDADRARVPHHRIIFLSWGLKHFSNINYILRLAIHGISKLNICFLWPLGIPSWDTLYKRKVETPGFTGIIQH